MIEQLCSFYTYVGIMRGSLFQNFLSPQHLPCFWFFHSLPCPPEVYLGMCVIGWFISHTPCALVSPSSGCDFDFHRLVQLVMQRCRICAWKQSLFGLHSQRRFLDLKTFSKKIYLIHVANSWVPAGSSAVPS